MFATSRALKFLSNFFLTFGSATRRILSSYRSRLFGTRHPFGPRHIRRRSFPAEAMRFMRTIPTDLNFTRHSSRPPQKK
jgi:hypothetical protein